MSAGSRGGSARVGRCVECGVATDGFAGIPVRDGRVCGRQCLRANLRGAGTGRGVTVVGGGDR